jgi:hypothetical protein
MPANEPKQILPEIDFATFVLSLASNALVHLGELPEPDGGADASAEAEGEGSGSGGGGGGSEVNLPLARQTIEILAMLEVKTKGNLDEAEANLLKSVLYDLRMKFVDAARLAKATKK